MSRLRWRCRRGIREMDILFERFLDECYEDLNADDKATFELFVEEPDLDILNWIMDRTKPENEQYALFIKTMQTLNA